MCKPALSTVCTHGTNGERAPLHVAQACSGATRLLCLLRCMVASLAHRIRNVLVQHKCRAPKIVFSHLGGRGDNAHEAAGLVHAGARALSSPKRVMVVVLATLLFT